MLIKVRCISVKKQNEYRCSFVGVVSSGQHETRFGIAHSGPGQVPVFQTRPLNVDYSLCPDRHLENHSHGGVELHRRQKNHEIVLTIATSIKTRILSKSGLFYKIQMWRGSFRAYSRDEPQTTFFFLLRNYSTYTLCVP